MSFQHFWFIIVTLNMGYRRINTVGFDYKEDTHEVNLMNHFCSLAAIILPYPSHIIKQCRFIHKIQSIILNHDAGRKRLTNSGKYNNIL